MVVNFRARGISRGTRKLARTPTLNKKKKKLLRGLCAVASNNRYGFISLSNPIVGSSLTRSRTKA
jgi:hypothetical protein